MPGLPRPRPRTRRLPKPLASPVSSRSLAALLHAVIALPLAVVGAVPVAVGLALGGALAWTTFGLWITALTVRGALALGSLQRTLSRVLLGEHTDPPGHTRTGDGPERGALRWRRALLTERAGWRAAAHALLAPLTAVPQLAAATVCYLYGLLLLGHPVLRNWNYHTVQHADGSVERVSLEVAGVQFDTWPRWLLPVVVGALLLAVASWLVRAASVPDLLLQRALLGPNAADQRIRTLEETRAQAVEDAAATLRRIERDLHDGTQVRLVGLGMHLTVIHELVAAGADREQVLRVVETARGNAKAAVADLRTLVKGIHPPVLDQGLATALATLAADSPLEVGLTDRMSGRPAPALESIAYFCVAELLANAAKHSGAERVDVAVSTGDGALRVTVRDEGRGGATVGAGSGLSGLLARVRTVDGTLTCDSPPGGPTEIDVRLPMP